ncbi:hypothetical protein Rhe02_09790 [Rhizocola hellebori]|uniref:Uncharacterized protein n=1 Tax=Rhizocola hellebori TaxID=1392758 RepID=A0A8J3Q3P6_9ACTN|nr:hypothetical protein [Rhizocola hellebori]GIH02912.1 hypothetical protein Rhe02_09790 [Rhizocola hellebori]
MYQRSHNSNQHACNCGCLVHAGKPRLFFTDPGCDCIISCASQPLTVHAPQTGGALFLDRKRRLWHIPGLGSGRWDGNSAIHSDADNGYQLIDAEPELADLLLAADDALAALLCGH